MSGPLQIDTSLAFESTADLAFAFGRRKLTSAVVSRTFAPNESNSLLVALSLATFAFLRLDDLV